MRRRWPEWVIVVGILFFTGAGIAAIWGRDLVRLFRSDDEPAVPTDTAPPVIAPGPTGTPI
jgi:hypothetical protein